MDFGTIDHNNPLAIFTFLVAPALLTNASTLLTLSTANRLARSVDRMRLIAAAVTAPEGKSPPGVPATLSHELAEAQFRPAAKRCRVMIRALRGCYLAIGCFATGTCVAMLGAALRLAGFQQGGDWSVMIVIALASLGVLAVAYAAANLVRESTSTLELLAAEEASIRKALSASEALAKPLNPAQHG